jgi:hypothetical protein
MALFALVPRTQPATVALDERVREAFPDKALRLDIGVWIVSGSGTPRQIADKLNIIEGGGEAVGRAHSITY